MLCAVLTALVGSARAADLGEFSSAQGPEGFQPGSIWAGSYAGFEAGLSQSGTEAEAGSAKTDFDRTDAAFGAFAGYNWEVSRFVLGVEAGGAYLGGQGKGTLSGVGAIKGGSQWTASLRGRAGVPIGNFMPYLSAGLAATEYTFEANGRKKSEVQFGPMLGAGLEVAAHDKWRVRADYALTGVLGEDKENFNGTTIKRSAGNHRLMLGISRAF
ncbi:outer membrane protein [Roseibium aquae]|uniref:Outer membrane protein n=2 Tax=Roseibium aquae TaxID=1323746 RepID=A0A916TMU8_9HYPH|nr:outer membrane protein [Roseibium aquae]